jgi:hypothetical protein
MWKRFIIGLVLVGAACGYPYAGWLLYRVLGTNTVTLTEQDGAVRTFVSGPAAPRPDWVPIMPGGLIVTGANWVPSPVQPPEGDTEFLSHADTENIAAFYTAELKSRGFAVNGPHAHGLDPATAGLLGLDGTLVAHNTESGEQMTIQIRSPSGLLLRPRLVQIHWRKG